MDDTNFIEQTCAFVQQKLKDAEGGHDWWHIHRVWTNAKKIAANENADLLVVELAALLHDIADSKFHNGDEEIGPKTAAVYLESIGVDDATVNHVEQIIKHMSFKSGFDGHKFYSIEMGIVQDADRLDAIGAIGIARCFTYGGFKNREIYNPEIPVNLNMTKEEYKNSTAPTINHFYEKLLLLKDKMNTNAGKQLAQQRHDFMLTYLGQFYFECGG
ncbi:HD domain-containing protein [Mucilaginibacter myungsuensis]